MITNAEKKIEVPGGCSTPDRYKLIAEAAKKLLIVPKKHRGDKSKAEAAKRNLTRV